MGASAHPGGAEPVRALKVGAGEAAKKWDAGPLRTDAPGFHGGRPALTLMGHLPYHLGIPCHCEQAEQF